MKVLDKSVLFKLLYTFLLATPIIFFITTGFLTDSWGKIFQVFTLGLVFSFEIAMPSYRRYALFLALLFTILMFILSVVSITFLSVWFGSTAFGIVLLTFITYMPDFFKRGYLDKL